MVFSLKKFYDIRVDNDLSQKEMSKILDISEDAYSNYENGRSAMPLVVAVRFADYFNLSLDYLLNLSGNKNLNCNKLFDEKNVSKRLINLRKQNKMSQKQFATLVNIPQRTYCSYERNERTIPFDFLFNISLALNISLDYLTNRCEESKII